MASPARPIYALLSLLSLFVCLLLPVLRFLGRMTADRFKFGLLFASIAWFVFASLWAAAAKKTEKR
jgi:uncharacterized SAM-binding protein YcdF (DUF218 family)